MQRRVVAFGRRRVSLPRSARRARSVLAAIPFVLFVPFVVQSSAHQPLSAASRQTTVVPSEVVHATRTRHAKCCRHADSRRAEIPKDSEQRSFKIDERPR